MDEVKDRAPWHANLLKLWTDPAVAPYVVNASTFVPESPFVVLEVITYADKVDNLEVRCADNLGDCRVIVREHTGGVVNPDYAYFCLVLDLENGILVPYRDVSHIAWVHGGPARGAIEEHFKVRLVDVTLALSSNDKPSHELPADLLLRRLGAALLAWLETTMELNEEGLVKNLQVQRSDVIRNDKLAYSVAWYDSTNSEPDRLDSYESVEAAITGAVIVMRGAGNLRHAAIYPGNIKIATRRRRDAVFKKTWLLSVESTNGEITIKPNRETQRFNSEYYAKKFRPLLRKLSPVKDAELDDERDDEPEPEEYDEE